MSKSRQKEASRVTLIGCAGNATLAGLKFTAGVFGNSAAMIADALHSLSDIGTDLLTLLAIRISSKPKDKNHKYGHGKVETLASAFMGFVILFVGIGVLVNAIGLLIVHYREQPLESPGLIAFLVAISSVAIKEILFRYTTLVGNKISSKVVLANALNHRSDALSSVAATLGIGGAVFLGPKFAILDPLAAVVVSIFIVKAAFLMIKESLLELIETSLPKHVESEILRLAQSVDGVFNPHDLKTRRVGNDIAVDMHICVCPKLNIEEAHKISVGVEQCIYKRFGMDTHISIHTEPLNNLEKS